MAERPPQLANVTVSYEMHADPRFRCLAELGGWTHGDACWRMVVLWARCTALATDQPGERELRVHLGPRAAELLVEAQLAEILPGGGVRVLGGGLSGGDTDRFGWFAPVSARNRAGGLARADRVKSTGARGPRGRFTATTSDLTSKDQQPSSEVTSVTSVSPASPSTSPASGFRIPDPEKISPYVRAIQPTAVPAPSPLRTEPPIVPAAPPPATAREDIAGKARAPAAIRAELVESIAGPYNPDDPRARGRLAESTYRRVSDALVSIAAELRLPVPLPFPVITPGSHPQSLRDLQDRVREEGAAAPLVCDRVVANLIAQAREERSVEWLAEKTFAAKPWARARQWTPGAAARVRGPQKGDPLPPAPAPKREPSAPLIVIPEDEREDVAAMARELRDRLNGTARAPPRSAETSSEHPDHQPQPKAAT